MNWANISTVQATNRSNNKLIQAENALDRPKITKLKLLIKIIKIRDEVCLTSGSSNTLKTRYTLKTLEDPEGKS